MPTIIPNVNVIDVEQCCIRSGHDVIIEGDEIVGLRRAERVDGDWRVLPGGHSRWVMPGLIDAHVHLLEEHEGADAGKLPDKELEKALAHGVGNIKAAVGAGITTLRDTGAFKGRNNILRDAVKEAAIPLARVLSCGHHITVKDGHFWDRGVVWDRNVPIEKLVEAEINAGADFIKVMNDSRIFDDRELRAIVNTAHALGKKVACHAFTEGQILQSIKCSVDTVEHGYPSTPEIMEALRNSGAVLCPTVVAAADSVTCLDNPQLLESFPDCTAEEFTQWYADVSRHLPAVFANKLPIITGTDAGILPTPFDSIHRELRFFQKHGASAWELLKSATVAAAAALGIENLTGQVTPGRSADLLILAQDPVADLPTALRHIELVMFRGNVVWRQNE